MQAQPPRETRSDEYISLMELFKQGITPRMVWQLLGPPDKSETDLHFPRRPELHHYLRAPVHEKTQGRTFQILRITNLIYQLAKGEGNLKSLTQWAQSVPIKTDFPDLQWEDVVQIGCLDRWKDRGFHIQPRETSSGMRALWGYTYLKHSCTNYDELCSIITGKMFARYTYPIILHRINEAILDRFPQCLERVKGLRQSPVMTCPTCRKRKRGIFNGHYWTKPPDWLYQLSESRNYIRVLCSRECTRRRRGIPMWARRANQYSPDLKPEQENHSSSSSSNTRTAFRDSTASSNPG